MSDETVAQFSAVTGAAAERAQQYLNLSDGNIEQAIQLWYETGGIDLMETVPASAPTDQPPPVPTSTRPTQDVIEIPSDDEGMPTNDSDVELTEEFGATGAVGGARSDPSAQPSNRGPAIEDDEAMARRLQEEMYGGGGSGGAPGPEADEVRAPIARTTETLVGPEPYDMSNHSDRVAAVAEQMYRRDQARRAGRSRPGGTPSIWDQNEDFSQRIRRQAEASTSVAAPSSTPATSKTTMLAEMYRPPFDLMSRLSWDQARDEGKEGQKWIIVNVQDPSIFDCQVLNRDIWKHEGIRETIKENFIFLQYSKDDPRGDQYMQYYFQNRDVESAYPHIAIVDPRTGEQVKVWSGAPAPKPMDFLMQLHEFLDRYSLNAAAKNPVAKRKPEPKQENRVERMTEEEQLEMAMQASLAHAGAGASSSAAAEGASRESDPDDLTRSIPDMRGANGGYGSVSHTATGHGGTSQADTTMADANAAAADSAAADATSPPKSSVFASIPSDQPHVEPPVGAPNATRIQFRHPEGRVVRRFALDDPVQRLYEWLKAEPLPGTEGSEFGLVFMGRNLVADVQDGKTVGEAGLRNGSVNVEVVEDG